MYCRRVEKRHDVSVGEHADLPQVRSLHLDAVCCPHLTDRPMRPHAAGSCSSTAGITRTCALEKLDTREGAVAAQRAAALDPVSTAAARAFMLSLQTLATGQECGSTRGSACVAHQCSRSRRAHLSRARCSCAAILGRCGPVSVSHAACEHPRLGPFLDECAITLYDPNRC